MGQRKKGFLEYLGCQLVDEWQSSVTHLVADTFRRTTKMMCAISAGAFVVRPEYVTACSKAGELVDATAYILADDVCAEAFARKRRLRFYSLAEALERRKLKGPMLKGFFVHCLPSVVESDEIFQLIVAAGGTWLSDFPSNVNDDAVLLIGDRYASGEDELRCRRDHRVYDVEMLREAACTQVLRRHTYLLRKERVRMTPSKRPADEPVA